MRARITFSLLIVATGLLSGRAADILPRFSHPKQITNSYLPLALLKQDILESKHARVERTAKPDWRKNFKVGEQVVEALVIEDREFENGKLSEVALDYFAQADDGTVYYLGEEVDDVRDGKVIGHTGAWLYGAQTHKLGVVMPAHPKAGDRFKPEEVTNVTWEEDEVVSVSETVTVPAGEYKGCLKIKERLSDGMTETKYYAPGVGCVKETEEDAEFVLKSHNGVKAVN